MTIGQGVYTNEHTHGHGCGIRCISWTAIFSGALVGIGLSFLLNLFSIAIGLSAYSMSDAGQTVLAVGGIIGILIGSIIAMFLSGFVAGYLGRPFCFKRNLGILYGFVTWALALLLTVLVASHVGNYVNYYSNNITDPTRAVIVTENPQAPMVSQTRDGERMVVNAQKAAGTLSMSAFLVFALFFIGAVASCFGGHCGMACKESECAPEMRNPSRDRR